VLARDYRLRLAVVIVWILIGLVLIAAVLLVPTYVFLTKSVNAKETRLANIESALSSVDEEGLSARLTALESATAVLVALGHAPFVSAAINTALAVPRPGVVLSNFLYVPAAGTNPGTLAISGRAATRDALRNYQLALQSAPFARSAALPVSAYAPDANIAFTVTVTLAP